jgi:hypothetical protein
MSFQITKTSNPPGFLFKIAMVMRETATKLVGFHR